METPSGTDCRDDSCNTSYANDKQAETISNQDKVHMLQSVQASFCTLLGLKAVQHACLLNVLDFVQLKILNFYAEIDCKKLLLSGSSFCIEYHARVWSGNVVKEVSVTI